MSRPTMTALSADAVLVAPSILAADFAHLAADVLTVEAAGALVLHLDIMDGHFVPNISFGPPVVKALRPVSGMVFDVHLMIDKPTEYIEPFVKAGADHITVHVESPDDIGAALQQIREAGCSTGVTLKPATPAEAIKPFADQLDMVLVMTVEPGFGGQSFMADMLPKVSRVRELLDSAGRTDAHVQVDGGIATDTGRRCVDAGANVLVAGSTVFRSEQGTRQAVADLAACAD